MKNKDRYYEMVMNHRGEWRRYLIIHSRMISTPDDSYTTRSELIRKQISSDYLGQ